MQDLASALTDGSWVVNDDNTVTLFDGGQPVLTLHGTSSVPAKALVFTFLQVLGPDIRRQDMSFKFMLFWAQAERDLQQAIKTILDLQGDIPDSLPDGCRYGHDECDGNPLTCMVREAEEQGLYDD